MKKILLSLIAMLAIVTNVKAGEEVLQINSAAFWNVSAPKSGAGTYLVSASDPEKSVTQGAVTIVTHKGDAGTASCVWNTNDVFTFRTYNKSTFNIQCTSNITSIVIEGVKGKMPLTYNGGAGSISTGETTITWTGSSTDVEFAATGTCQLNSITVTYGGEAPKVAPVTFSVPAGTYTTTQTVELACATEGATIYYQTSGDWSDAVAYSAPITVSKTTTIYAQAVKGADKGVETSATYTIEKVNTYSSINEIYALEAGNTFSINADLTVVFAKGNNTVVTDGTRYLLIYGSTGKTYKAGDIIPAGWSAKYSIYNGVGQATAPFTNFQDAKGTGTLPEYTVVKTDDALLTSVDTNNMYLTPVEFQGVEFTISNKNITVEDDKGEFACYNQYNITVPTVEEGHKYNVKGLASMYKTTYQVNVVAIEDQATGIITLVGERGMDEIYNLNGQKLNKAQKGINIINGKKVVVK